MSAPVTPTRSLTDRRRPHKYTRSESTDIRKTWARAARRERLLAFFRRER